MSLRELTSYRVVCDVCGLSCGTFDGRKYMPQEVLRLVEDSHGWFVDDETTICAGCPQPRDEEEPDGQG